MNMLKTFSLLFFLTCNVQIFGQSINFSKIEYASFDVNSYRTPLKNTACLAVYSEIDSTGLIKLSRDDDYNNKNTYFRYQLSSLELKKLGAFFNFNSQLKKSVKEYKFKKDEEFYGGSYHYFVVTYSNGTKDSICTIPPFMLKKFDVVYSMLNDIYYGDSKKKDTRVLTPTKEFKTSLYKSYLKNKFLPIINVPISFRLEDQK